MDSTGAHATGKPLKWTNKITLRYRTYDKGAERIVELEAAPDVPIRYTTDGSNPKINGGTYLTEFAVPETATHVLAVAEKKEIISDTLIIKIDRVKKGAVEIDPYEPLRLKNDRQKTDDTSATYKVIAGFKKHHAVIYEVLVTLYRTDEKTDEKGWIELSIDLSTPVDPQKLEEQIGSLRDNFMNAGKINISLEYTSVKFECGQDFLDWVADSKLALTDFNSQQIVQ